MDKINQLAINRDLEKLFRRARKQKTTLKPIPPSCSPQDLLNHFRKHFNPIDPSKTSTPEELSTQLPNFVEHLRKISDSLLINDNPPDIEEIETHLQKLKSNKASSDVDPELLKRCCHPVMLQVIHRMTTKLWGDLDLPNDWGNSLLRTLWKGKGSKKDPEKYRGLSIASTVCKSLVVNIILNYVALARWLYSKGL